MTTISNVWEGIKSLIKTPHIEVTGHFSIAGIDTPIPKLGLKWYAQGGIMTRPTVFGINGGNAMVGGEAGAEAVLPLDMLWRKLAELFKANTASDSGARTENNINITVYANTNDPDRLAEIVAGKFMAAVKNM